MTGIRMTGWWVVICAGGPLLPFDRKTWLVRVVERIMVSNLPVYHRNATPVTVWIQKKGRICVAWVWNREGTEKLVNGKQHSVWFVPTGMKGLPQNALLNFRLEFPKSYVTIYLPSGISEIFCQMVRSPGHSQSVIWLSKRHIELIILLPRCNRSCTGLV